jgi:hypothetical protein
VESPPALFMTGSAEEAVKGRQSKGRAGWLIAVVLAGFAGGYAVPKPQSDPHWMAVTGTDWQRFSPEARQAYLNGFLLGGALAQALDGKATGTAGLASSLDSLRHGGLNFPYGANVYLARTDDYFWWEDHRALPVWHALWEVNNDLKGLTQHDSQ